MKNKALIVIDVQNYFLTSATKPIVKRIQQYLKNQSKQYATIYFTVFKNDPRAPLWKISDWQGCSTAPETDICRELAEFTNKNNLFSKNILSAYKVSAIKTGLKQNKISQVDLCGFDTDCCVFATAYDLFDEGFKPVILENLTWSTAKEKLHLPAIKMIQRNIGFTKLI